MPLMHDHPLNWQEIDLYLGQKENAELCSDFNRGVHFLLKCSAELNLSIPQLLQYLRYRSSLSLRAEHLNDGIHLL